MRFLARLGVLLLSLVCAVCVGCGRSAGGKAVVQPVVFPQSTGGNFVLYVSNQSFERPSVDITVLIDGKVAVSAMFNVDRQHTWIPHEFQLAPGDHEVRISSGVGEAAHQGRFTISADRHWAVIDFWCARGSEETSFSFDCHDRPVFFL